MIWTKLSKKQRRIFTWWTTDKYDALICDGSVRSGKTICMSTSFVMWAMTRFDNQQFALCGKTIGSLRRNMTNGFASVFEGIYTVKEKRSENLIEISDGEKINRFYLFGGKDESSQDLIQGLTLAGVLFDEVALMPESFVNQATARCSVDGSKFWFNCNPAGPHHWFKTGWIDKTAERKALHLHFTMDDNLSLSEETKARYYALYSGVFFERYVLGKWRIAEGLIYSMFSRTKNIVSNAPFDLARAKYFFSCDYGTNNPCAIGLFARGHHDGNKCYYMVREYYHNGREHGQKTDSEYANDLEALANDNGIKDKTIIVDPSAASFITELRRRGWKVLKARNDVLDGIRYVSEFLSHGLLLIDESCECTLKEFEEYAWDEKASERGEDKPIKQNDHAMDMIRYALFTDRHDISERTNHSGRGAV